ncbi:hypothetical protein GCK72_009031 [Caenorhabditis remanei]|uniref:Skp1-related protein n=1 Tax=Caenorhabditis remanei TaxID=31234 RepID=A0A6A5H186_CAERE|nr:hypothetical protein GCK72_009031 [Caenorhabditis remanei]KAF1760781.1 hypothetical protein GCK72_009031 [Caenorhabditis remanei]
MAEQAPVDVAPVAEAEPIYYFKLGSCDDKEVKISSEAIKQSKTLNDLVSNLQYNAEEGESTEVIPMDNIKEPTLVKVRDWCEKHKGEPIPVDDESVPKNVTIPEWDEEFLKIDNDELFHLILAANYLDIKQLLNYACKKVALMAKGKSPEELRAIFAIPTDEEDEAAEKAAAEKKKAKEAEKAAAAAAGEAGPSDAAAAN